MAGKARIYSLLIIGIAFSFLFGCLEGPQAKAVDMKNNLRGGTYCEDTDGNNVFVKGTCTDDMDAYEDGCASPTQVKEGYCAQKRCVIIVASCSPGYACENGMCVISGKAVCEEGLVGNDAQCSGKWVQRKFRYSDCREVWVPYRFCEKGCSNGTCKNESGESVNCVESDKGINVYEKGTCKSDVNPATYLDYCTNGKTVTEYYCSPGGCFFSRLNCTYGYDCVNGACAKES